jgi:iron-sulfur cluster assembly protein
MNLTGRAINRLKQLDPFAEKGQSGFVRIEVIPGGCSGLSYKMLFDSGQLDEQDIIEDHEGLQIVVNREAYSLLKEVELDFPDDLNAKGFRFNNPNARRSCHCGSSFSA